MISINSILTAALQCSDITEWLPQWPENLKQAVNYEGYLRRKSVY